MYTVHFPVPALSIYQFIQHNLYNIFVIHTQKDRQTHTVREGEAQEASGNFICLSAIAREVPNICSSNHLCETPKALGSPLNVEVTT